MLDYFWIGLGGAIGSMGRFWISSLVAHRFGEAFPLGTLLVNVTGSLAIGFIVSYPMPEGRWLATPAFKVFFMTGICGGYTTFSSFSLQTFNLAQRGEWPLAALNAVLSMTLCIGAVWLGHWLGGTIGSPKAN